MFKAELFRKWVINNYCFPNGRSYIRHINFFFQRIRANGKSAYLDRAIECAKYTLPTLITDNARSSGKNLYTKINTTYQGLGARGVNNLASKLLIALLPPNQAFFRLSVDLFIAFLDNKLTAA